MKRIFTLSLLILCFAFTSYAQVQIGNSLMGSAAGDEFGKTVSINASGTRISVAAPNEGFQGTVHFYDNSGSSWGEMAIGAGLLSVGTMNRLAGDGNSSTHFVPSSILSLTVFNTNTQQWDFGSFIQNPTIEALDIAISGDGQRVISGGETQTRIFEKDANGAWTQLGQSIAQRADFVDISGDGSRIIINNSESTHYRTYSYNSATAMWEIQFTSSAGAGGDVAMSNSGEYIAEVALGFNLIEVVSFNIVTIIGNPISIGTEDVSVDLSADGSRIVVSNKGTNKATKLYEFNGTDWAQVGETIDFSGSEVAISADGTIVAIGDASANDNQGEVRVYDFSLVNVTNIEATNINIFPNPTFGLIQLQNVNPDVVEIFDNTGRVVKTIAHPGNSLDISEMAAGFYFLKIYEGEKVFSAKVIKE